MRKYTQEEEEAPTATSVVSSSLQDQNRKLYRRRWVVLLFFFLNIVFMIPHATMYTIIAHITKKYYNASIEEVNMTGNIGQLIAVLFYIPAAWMLDKTNLRFTCLLAFLLTTIGAWIKVIAVDPSLYWLINCAHGLMAIGGAFIYTIPARFAVVWFGKNEVSTACSLIYFGTMIGFVVGFQMVPRLITEITDLEITRSQFYTTTIGLAGINTLLFLLLVIYFPAAPPSPPNNAVNDSVPSTKEFIKSLKDLVTNVRFILFLVGNFFLFSSAGVFYYVIDEVIQDNFEGEELMASTTASIYMGAGTISVPIYGLFMDKTKKYRELLWTLSVAACACLVSFPFVYEMKSKAAVYAVSFIYGLAGLGESSVRYENIVELTYPVKEFTSCGFCNVVAGVSVFIVNLVFTSLLSNFGSFWANVYLACAAVVGVFFTFLVGRRLRRQEVFNS